ncbi:exported hypothetical protein [Microcystis aeruginosa PCC 9443]|uniref:Aconitase B HEAT-like domain-containing protein n=1 Tax=Microcystis aeruginosa PCC 9443 TaxID=1160281 RepID=I4G0Y4_MICAE|nr:exported hypothetical protein [Microcystis aeruginosa PCC 9443]
MLKSRDINIAAAAASALSKTLLVFDAFNEVLELSDTNPYAKQVIDAWANGAWFIAKPKLANRPDILLHALVC